MTSTKSASFVLVAVAGLGWALPSAWAVSQGEAAAPPRRDRLEASSLPPDRPAPAAIRAGGDYLVESIDRLEDGSFVVVFKSVKSTGRFDTLRLSSDHLHVAVKVGQKLRLSAEIMAENAASAEVTQLVLFMPQVEGRVPVWLLSNKAKDGELRATRYLEMHVPQNDFIIM